MYLYVLSQTVAGWLRQAAQAPPALALPRRKKFGVIACVARKCWYPLAAPRPAYTRTSSVCPAQPCTTVCRMLVALRRNIDIDRSMLPSVETSEAVYRSAQRMARHKSAAEGDAQNVDDECPATAERGCSGLRTRHHCPQYRRFGKV